MQRLKLEESQGAGVDGDVENVDGNLGDDASLDKDEAAASTGPPGTQLMPIIKSRSGAIVNDGDTSGFLFSIINDVDWRPNWVSVSIANERWVPIFSHGNQQWRSRGPRPSLMICDEQ
ncbi:hypothetical protein LWI28_012401 [Acer negundo]|uniref:Uncharacterized protein n=1 Tax=Acer negundo TaxID=4023 RepID=A0AAD5IVV1_ACENE|nr:hypothetical protein LWI28_012401 [Acer negundo]